MLYVFRGTSPAINIEDALQRMHQAEQSGQVLILTHKRNNFHFLFYIEISFVTLSTYINTLNDSELVDTINFLSSQ